MDYLTDACLHRILMMQSRFDTVACVNKNLKLASLEIKQGWVYAMTDALLSPLFQPHPNANPSPWQCAMMTTDIPEKMLVRRPLPADTPRPYIASSPAYSSASLAYSPAYSPTSPAYSPTSPAYSPTNIDV